MKIIVGLGNPGKKHLLDRHNLGFMLMDCLAGETPFQNQEKSLVSKTQIAETKVLLVKPQTFMNLSGSAVQALINFYKIPLEDLLVVHDDKDLTFGTMKFQKSRGAGGHNGIAHIHQQLNSSDYPRLKMGIAPKSLKEQEENHNFPTIKDTARFVLSPFDSEEQKKLPQFLEQAVQAIHFFLTQGFEKSANEFNSKSGG